MREVKPTKRRRLVAVLVFVALGSFVAAVGLYLRPRDTLARARFDQIALGMTRQQVEELMADVPDEDSTFGHSLDDWRLPSGYMLFVKFDPPDPEKLDPGDLRGDNWIATNVTLVDCSKANLVQDWLRDFHLWPAKRHQVKEIEERQ